MIFEVTEGWSAGIYKLSASQMENPQTMANNLSGNNYGSYYYEIWTRK